MKGQAMKSIIAVVLLIAAAAIAGDEPDISKLSIKQLRVLAVEQQQRIARLELENTELRKQVASLAAARTDTDERASSTVPGLRLKIMPGETPSMSPNGTRLICFSMKITNTSAAPISLDFRLRAIDEDGDLIGIIESEMSRSMHGVYALAIKQLKPGESVVKAPYMQSQDYERLHSIVLEPRPNPMLPP